MIAPRPFGFRKETQRGLGGVGLGMGLGEWFGFYISISTHCVETNRQTDQTAEKHLHARMRMGARMRVYSVENSGLVVWFSKNRYFFVSFHRFMTKPKTKPLTKRNNKAVWFGVSHKILGSKA